MLGSLEHPHQVVKVGRDGEISVEGRALVPRLPCNSPLSRRTVLACQRSQMTDSSAFGDKIRVNLHHGKIEDAVVRAVIQDEGVVKLQVDVVGLDLTALIHTRQVIE